ncbi:MAG: histidinol dehydrogenase [bacterium]
MKLISHADKNFEKELNQFLSGIHEVPPDVMEKAAKIFDEVTAQGDTALFKWTRELENHEIDANTVKVTDAEISRALGEVSRSDLDVIELAAKRIRAFHKKQSPKGFTYNDNKGTVIKERIIPLQRAGVYIPGGRFPLASTVLMTAIPAQIAGVKEIIMITPCPGGKLNPCVLAAARSAGVDAVYKVGGVQGIAALACGTASIPRADKIVGPGSSWVAAAKTIADSRGLCGTDAVAGPSEIVVVADESAPAEAVAADLLSQAEHGPDSVSILVTTSDDLVKKVERELKKLVEELPEIEDNPDPAASVSAILVKDLEQASAIVNRIAPEHLEIIVKKPQKFADTVNNAGSVFLGPYSPVPAGDYTAGANHVLPTGGTARFSSPLGVQDFVKRQSVTRLSKEGLAGIREATARFADLEGLKAHARAVLSRLPERDKKEKKK